MTFKNYATKRTRMSYLRRRYTVHRPDIFHSSKLFFWQRIGRVTQIAQPHRPRLLQQIKRRETSLFNISSLTRFGDLVKARLQTFYLNCYKYKEIATRITNNL